MYCLTQVCSARKRPSGTIGTTSCPTVSLPPEDLASNLQFGRTCCQLPLFVGTVVKVSAMDGHALLRLDENIEQRAVHGYHIGQRDLDPEVALTVDDIGQEVAELIQSAIFELAATDGPHQVTDAVDTECGEIACQGHDHCAHPIMSRSHRR